MTSPVPARARLIVFSVSHFGERARWALDRAGIVYDEERWAPGLHAWRAKRLGLSRTQTPVLVGTDGAMLQGSEAILDALDPPGGDAEIEARCVRAIGPLVRRYLYSAALDDPRSGVREALLAGVAPGEARLARLVWPLTRLLMRKGFRAAPEHLPELSRRLGAELAWLGETLAARGGAHLVGGAFGRADLTAASLLSPLLAPPQCPVGDLYGSIRLPPAVADEIARWRAEPALAFAARLYAEHRRAREPTEDGSRAL